jgi:hypothetical protein
MGMQRTRIETQTTEAKEVRTMKAEEKSAAKTETYEGLMARGRDGVRRIEKLSWGRLARIYYANRPNSLVRKAINAEAGRCGYTPRIIRGINSH